MSRAIHRAAAIVATIYVFGYLVFINWAGAVQLEVPLIVGVLTLVSGPVAMLAASAFWWRALQ